MSCFLAALYSSTEPFMTPWSVSASAGWSNSAARLARASMLQAPSSSEYSEWTWRCAQPVLTGQRMLGAGSDGLAGPPTRLPEGAGSTWREPASAIEPAVQRRGRLGVAAQPRGRLERELGAAEDGVERVRR